MTNRQHTVSSLSKVTVQMCLSPPSLVMKVLLTHAELDGAYFTLLSSTGVYLFELWSGGKRPQTVTAFSWLIGHALMTDKQLNTGLTFQWREQLGSKLWGHANKLWAHSKSCNQDFQSQLQRLEPAWQTERPTQTLHSEHQRQHREQLHTQTANCLELLRC